MNSFVEELVSGVRELSLQCFFLSNRLQNYAKRVMGPRPGLSFLTGPFGPKTPSAGRRVWKLLFLALVSGHGVCSPLNHTGDWSYPGQRASGNA